MRRGSHSDLGVRRSWSVTETTKEGRDQLAAMSLAFCWPVFQRAVVTLLASAITLGCSTRVAPPPNAATRPSIHVPHSAAFDVTEVPQYAGDHADVYAYIDANLDAHLSNLRRWVGQPSVSAQNLGIREMAAMLRDDLRQLGFDEVELVPTAGHPGVWGFYDAAASTTLAVYMMYDVQPVERADWSVGAFDGALVNRPSGKVLMARGATNQKGPERAFLNALEAIIRIQGKLPVNLMIIAEGEEELGSPNLPTLIEKFADRLKSASGVLFPFNSQTPSGDVNMFLGVKGVLSFEMEARGGRHGGPTRAEIHSSYKAITDAPALRLIQAIASLTTADGNTITVPRYYDAIRRPSDEEQQLANAVLTRWAAMDSLNRESLGVVQWIDNMAPRDALLEILFGTTLNVNGIWSGYTGPGGKTILPHVATARLDSRLVPDQDPDSAFALIRAHLDRQGFTDVTLRKQVAIPPAQTSVRAPLARAAIGAYRKYGLDPMVMPRLAGSAPYYLFTKRLGLPVVTGGIGHGSGAHAPDEYMVVQPAPGSRVAGLAAIEKFYVDLLYALAEAARR
jgi:acetylornithine deacetylase/succinyl-diaminopimelate desuccinylase-like protein